MNSLWVGIKTNKLSGYLERPPRMENGFALRICTWSSILSAFLRRKSCQSSLTKGSGSSSQHSLMKSSLQSYSRIAIRWVMRLLLVSSRTTPGCLVPKQLMEARNSSFFAPISTPSSNGEETTYPRAGTSSTSSTTETIRPPSTSSDRPAGRRTGLCSTVWC